MFWKQLGRFSKLLKPLDNRPSQTPEIRLITIAVILLDNVPEKRGCGNSQKGRLGRSSKQDDLDNRPSSQWPTGPVARVRS